MNFPLLGAGDCGGLPFALTLRWGKMTTGFYRPFTRPQHRRGAPIAPPEDALGRSDLKPLESRPVGARGGCSGRRSSTGNWGAGAASRRGTGLTNAAPATVSGRTFSPRCHALSHWITRVIWEGHDGCSTSPDTGQQGESDSQEQIRIAQAPSGKTGWALASVFYS
ncbi:MAG: hypothetical protein RLZZ612_1657 [Pseudomonadota bacterium]|jgi:hypothetical protein